MEKYLSLSLIYKLALAHILYILKFYFDLILYYIIYVIIFYMLSMSNCDKTLQIKTKLKNREEKHHIFHGHFFLLREQIVIFII